jgi:SAM-dependent methyltransferase
MSLERLETHRRVWKEKPILAEIYRVWFDALLLTIPASARVLEVGAGPGLLSEYARAEHPGLSWLATDILEAPWNELVADGSQLPIRGESVDAVAAFDLVHHLADPARFFSEARRVLRPGGKIAVIEPWVSPASYPVYRFLHEEGCRLGIDPWDPFGVAGGGTKTPFTGDAAILRQLVRKTPKERWEGFGLLPPRTTLFNGFAYALSMGFQPRSLLPPRLLPLFQALDRRAAVFAPLCGFRVLAVWERRAETESAASRFRSAAVL